MAAARAAAPPSQPPSWFARVDHVLLAIVAFAVLVRLGVVWQLHDHPLLQPSPELDTGVYLDLARRVASGDLLAGDRVFFVSPFYIYFAAIVLALTGGSVLAVQVVQAMLGGAAAWMMADTARLWFGKHAGWLAGALIACTGYFAFNESLLLQSAVDPFLTALGLWALARAWTSGRTVPSLVAGIALGLHSLNRPNVLAWAAAAAALTALLVLWRAAAARKGGARTDSGGGQRALVPLAALLAGLLLALAPVALRNYAVSGQFAVTSHGGLNFFIGNNERADGSYRTVPGITPSISGQDRDMRRVVEKAVGRPVTDVEASSWFYDQAWEWIRTHPGEALALFARKIAYAFNAEDIPLNDSYTYYATDESLLLRLLFVGPWLLLPLGLAGIWLGRPHAGHRPRVATENGERSTVDGERSTVDGERSTVDGERSTVDGERSTVNVAWWMWVSFVPVYALSIAIFFVTGRYRQPLLVPMSVLSAATMTLLVESVRAWVGPALRAGRGSDAPRTHPYHPGGHPAVPLVLVVVLAVATNWNLGIDNGLAGWRAEMVLADIKAGRDEHARELLARTEPIYPNRGLLLYRVGRAYMSRGDAQNAMAVFERGLALDPDRGELRVAMGEALVQAGRPNEAIPMLEAALRTRAVEDRARMALARALFTLGRPGEAGAALRSLAAPERLEPSAQLAAGRLALENGDAVTAQPFFERAARLAPSNADVHEALGLALATQGRRTEALGALEQACRLDPGSASARFNLAILYAELGRFGEARDMAQQALRLRPDYAQARQFLSAISGR